MKKKKFTAHVYAGWKDAAPIVDILSAGLSTDVIMQFGQLQFGGLTNLQTPEEVLNHLIVYVSAQPIIKFYHVERIFMNEELLINTTVLPLFDTNIGVINTNELYSEYVKSILTDSAFEVVTRDGGFVESINHKIVLSERRVGKEGDIV